MALLLGCDGAATEPRRLPASTPPSSARNNGTASASRWEAAAAGSDAAAPSSAATGAASAGPPPRPRAAGELPGRTIDYPYDAADVGDRSRAYVGRAFVHDAALPPASGPATASTKPLPLLVFIHGLNKELIPHRWMGGGNEGDVRRLAADLIDSGALPPLIVAGPGSISPPAVSHGASFPKLDFDRFVELTEAALAGVARIDRTRIVVTGHSGAGCSPNGGLVAAVRANTKPLAVISIDTCMPAPLAEALGRAPPDTHVVVTWQTASWKRNFDHFRKIFQREATAHPPSPGVLRELDPLPALARAHDATVGQTFAKWLPKILPPSPSSPPLPKLHPR